MRKIVITAIVLILSTLASPAVLMAGDLPTLRFAYQDRVGSVIPIVAAQKGFFSAAGVKVESVQFNSGPANAETLYSGAVDVAGMGDTAALIMVSRRPDMIILASHATGEHRHRLMVKADSPFQRLEDLKGRTVGIKKGTSTHGGLLLALKKHGISASELNLMDLNPSTMNEALAAGSIDAFAASEPTPSVAEANGARQLETFGGLGNEYPILILAPKAFVSANTETLKRFFNALREAEAYTSTHPEIVVELLAEQSGLSPLSVKNAMSRHSYALRMDEAITGSLEQTAEFLKKAGVLEEKPEVAKHVDSSFLP